MARTWLVLVPVVIILWATLQVAVPAVVSAADRTHPPVRSAESLARLAREVAAHVIFGVLAWLALGRPRARRIVPDGVAVRPRPVLLVSGLTHNRASLWLLRTYLTQRGFQWVDLYERAGGTIAEDAAGLARQLADLRAASGAAEVDVVGFASGGLVAAHAASAPGIRRLITLGTPWRGTRTAVFRRGRAAHELRYSPTLLVPWPPAAEVVCIVATEDPVIVPAESGEPEGARMVRIEDGGHLELLASARAFRAVLAELERVEAA